MSSKNFGFFHLAKGGKKKTNVRPLNEKRQATMESSGAKSARRRPSGAADAERVESAERVKKSERT
jgi:hypothetical protein